MCMHVIFVVLCLFFILCSYLHIFYYSSCFYFFFLPPSSYFLSPFSSNQSSSSTLPEPRDRASTFPTSHYVNDKPPRPTTFPSMVHVPSDVQQYPPTPEDMSPPNAEWPGSAPRTPLSHVTTMLQSTSRRNSFLYQGDLEDGFSASSSKPVSRSPSISR